MTGRLGIDFGTSNSVVGVWDPRRNEGVPLELGELGIDKRVGEDSTQVVPSVVCYEDATTTWYGGQVLRRNLYEDLRTFRWMKRYISQRLAPVPRNLPDGRIVTPVEAGASFVTRLLQDAVNELGGDDEEVAFAVPVESFEDYEKWLRDIADAAGVRRFRLIDEASAAALGYGTSIQPGDVYLVFDFGGGTLDVSVVRIEEEHAEAASGRRCRVLGKHGANIGGASIDEWIYAWVLKQAQRNPNDEDVRRLSAELLVQCENAKERLSAEDECDIAAQDPETGKVISIGMKRTEFEGMLDEHALFTHIERVLRSAIGHSESRGFGEDDIKQVLAVGGSSLIPSIQTQLKRRFGAERVAVGRPMTAVACGAAAFVAGVDFYDFIQHDYALRHVNPDTGAYEYRTIVPAGTHYPTEGPVYETFIKATVDGQTEMGIQIFELSTSLSINPQSAVELVFDRSGAARLVEATVDEQHRRSHFWMNEDAQTFLQAEPPGKRGNERFRVQFFVDDAKRLLITAEDVETHRWLFDRTPVIRLT